MRRWSGRHAAGLKRVYDACARCAPYLRRPAAWLGAAAAERMLYPAERAAKGLMFDCRMCGQCTLSATGMVCPTNCPKEMRNGPCGGVRADGACEVEPAMRCVGVHVPDSLLARIAQSNDEKREGRTVLVETIRALAAMEGVAGVHLMAHRNEDVLAAAIVESGVREPARVHELETASSRGG